MSPEHTQRPMPTLLGDCVNSDCSRPYGHGGACSFNEEEEDPMAGTGEDRERWMAALTDLADDIGQPLDCWQLELAARILADRPYRRVTGRGDIWIFAQTRALHLGREMTNAGRLNKWGNWPSKNYGEPMPMHIENVDEAEGEG